MRSMLAMLVLLIVAACAGGASDLSVHDGNMRAVLHLPSHVVGEMQTIRWNLFRGDAAVRYAEVTVQWSMDEMAMGGEPVRLAQREPGGYEEPGFAFSMAGRWTARVVISMPNGERRTLLYSVTATD